MALNILAFIISVAVFSGLGLIYAFFETTSWSRRQSKVYVDCYNILMFLYFSCGMLANAVLIVMFGYAGYTLIIYKGQSEEATALPDESETKLFLFLLSVSFGFKAIEVLGIIFFQCTTDIFLIDWEHPQVEGQSKVSAWRSIFIANEWNEIQTFRKTNFTFQLLAVLLFLEVIGLKSLAQENSNGENNPSPTNPPGSPTNPTVVYNALLRFAIASVVYLVAEAVQVLYHLLVHERLIHDKMREFVDLCSVANVSLFILSYRNFGYYIHGRSVHGRADTDMLDLDAMLKKEGAKLTPSRGLENGTDLQTFTVAVSSDFRALYDKVYQPISLVRNQPSAVRKNQGQHSIVYESARAYTTMRTFLSSFIDHTIYDVGYKIKHKVFLESILDIEFETPLPSTCLFYADPQLSFTNCLYYGREFSLVVFDLLLFTIIDFQVFDFLLAAIITYVVVKFLSLLRQSFGRSNLSRKTLVDKRFLI